MPEPGELLSAFDKDCQDLHLSQEYVQDLIPERITGDRVAPDSVPREPEKPLGEKLQIEREFFARAKRHKNLSPELAFELQQVLQKAKYSAAGRVDDLATELLEHDGRNVDGAVRKFVTGCQALVRRMWAEKRNDFARFDVEEEAFTSAIFDERSEESESATADDNSAKFKLPIEGRYCSLTQRIRRHIQHFLKKRVDVPQAEQNSSFAADTPETVGRDAPGKLRLDTNRIKTWKHNEGHTNKTLAKLLGCTPRAIQSVINSGKFPDAVPLHGTPVLGKLAIAMKCDVTELYLE